jgi:hypothetical protein
MAGADGHPANGSSRVTSRAVSTTLLMERVRARITDLKVTRLVRQCLKDKTTSIGIVPQNSANEFSIRRDFFGLV